jgi:hypothetical protein
MGGLSPSRPGACQRRPSAKEDQQDRQDLEKSLGIQKKSIGRNWGKLHRMDIHSILDGSQWDIV